MDRARRRGYIGEPEPPTVRVEINSKQQGRTVIANLPISPDKSMALTVAILHNGRPDTDRVQPPGTADGAARPGAPAERKQERVVSRGPDLLAPSLGAVNLGLVCCLRPVGRNGTLGGEEQWATEGMRAMKGGTRWRVQYTSSGG